MALCESVGGHGPATPAPDPGRLPERTAGALASQPSVRTAAGTPAARGLFRHNCVKCHGADGTGNAARGRLREIPNLTDASWQAKRSDAQLLASILDGKGTEMPPARAKSRRLTGKIHWAKNLIREYKLDGPPVWGWAAHPLLDGDGPGSLSRRSGSGSQILGKSRDVSPKIVVHEPLARRAYKRTRYCTTP
jgi:Cytochrome C oxidase, cbb3-type, subunit III